MVNKRKKLRFFLAGLVLACLSVFVMLGAMEAGLRMFYPRYADAANNVARLDKSRLWSYPPHTGFFKRHPVDRSEYSIIYNNEGLRMERDIDQSVLANRRVYAIFGDSYIEAQFAKIQYTLPSVLEYLLTQAGPKPAYVLNMGLNGYGQEQEYIHYLQSSSAKMARHVFYVFCDNDFDNNFATNLLGLDENGELYSRANRRVSPVVRFLSRFHLTYLVLDAWNRSFNNRIGFLDSARKDAVLELKSERKYKKQTGQIKRIWKGYLTNELDPQEIKKFQVVLKAWRDKVEENGGQFHIVLLPEEKEQHVLKYIPDGFSVINLLEDFQKLYPEEYEDNSKAKFGRQLYIPRPFRLPDGHWNELAMMVASRLLYEKIAKMEGFEPVDRQAQEDLLAEYYMAFNGGKLPDYVNKLDFAGKAEYDADKAEELIKSYTSLRFKGINFEESSRQVDY